MTELETLQAELQWAIAANAEHPRTQNALEWAAEVLGLVRPEQDSREFRFPSQREWTEEEKQQINEALKRYGWK